MCKVVIYFFYHLIYDNLDYVSLTFLTNLKLIKNLHENKYYW